MTYDTEATRVELDMDTFGYRVFRGDSEEPAWTTETLVQAQSLKTSLEAVQLNHVQVKGHHPPPLDMSQEDMDALSEHILRKTRTGNTYFYASIVVKLWQVDTYLGYPMGDEYRETIHMDRVYEHHANLMQFVGGMGERVLNATKDVVSQYLTEDEMYEVEWIWQQLPQGGDPTHNTIAERHRQVRESCASSAA
jgi:hypothetical protein